MLWLRHQARKSETMSFSPSLRSMKSTGRLDATFSEPWEGDNGKLLPKMLQENFRDSPGVDDSKAHIYIEEV